MAMGKSHTKRYFTSFAACPFGLTGHTSTSRKRRWPISARTTMPPMLPRPDAVDQTMVGSTGSGVAQPLSPPPTAYHAPRGISDAPVSTGSAVFVLLGPQVLGPSCMLPQTVYGTRLSVVTW